MPRKASYDEDYLIEAMNKVALEYKEKQMTPRFLYKETGIPEHIWKANTYPKMRKRMKALNTKASSDDIISNAKISISDMPHEIEKAMGNYSKIQDIALRHREIEQQLIKICVTLKAANENLEKVNKELTLQIKERVKRCDELEAQLEKCYVWSTDVVARRDNNLKTFQEIVGPIDTRQSLIDSEVEKAITDLLLK